MKFGILSCLFYGTGRDIEPGMTTIWDVNVAPGCLAKLGIIELGKQTKYG